MKKIGFILCSVFLLSVVSAQAALYKGQRVYSRVCMECHTGGEAFVGEKTQFEWAEFMEDRGKKLSEVHLESEKFKEEKKYKKYKKYFKSKKFKKRAKHLKQFLMEYAEDSGNVPACS